jgi:hypothetical protein
MQDVRISSVCSFRLEAAFTDHVRGRLHSFVHFTLVNGALWNLFYSCLILSFASLTTFYKTPKETKLEAMTF